MQSKNSADRFEQIHIDVARNSTDDFNPFHDSRRWERVRGNPFGGPIVLGFQLEMLIEHLVGQHRQVNGEEDRLNALGLAFSNYQINFAGALRSGEAFWIEVKKTIDSSASGGGLSNRVVVRKENRDPVLLATVTETPEPSHLADADFSACDSVNLVPDRSLFAGGRYFLKRKFLNTASSKNFLLGSLVDPYQYFDEIAERVLFPGMFPTALISCALLEKGWQAGYDFEGDPMLYVGHRISIDRRLQRGLKSNERLLIVVEGPETMAGGKGLGNAACARDAYRCFGLLDGNRVLFRAQVQLARLADLFPGGRPG